MAVTNIFIHFSKKKKIQITKYIGEKILLYSILFLFLKKLPSRMLFTFLMILPRGNSTHKVIKLKYPNLNSLLTSIPVGIIMNVHTQINNSQYMVY